MPNDEMNAEDEALVTTALAGAGAGAIDSTETLTGRLDGPKVLFHTKTATAWLVSRARADAEARGRVLGHSLAPRVLFTTERVIVMPRVGPAPADLVAVTLEALPSGINRQGSTLRTLLDAPEVRADRALTRIGLKRSAIDRLLGTEVVIESERGPSLGGLLPAWLRTIDGRPASISVARAEASGWAALDLASLALHAQLDLREAHRARGGEADARDRAYDAFLLRAMLREIVLGEGEEIAPEAEALARTFLPGSPERVVVTIEAPPAVDLARFAPLGEVAGSHARFLVRALDGLHVAGGTIAVRTKPAIHAGRARRSWEPRPDREARIDPRFGELRFDEEALFSATPRAIADELVRRAHGVVLDATCGAGLLALAAARRTEVREVVGCDVDRRRVAMATHNAEVYGLGARVRFVQGDALAMIAETRPDTLVLDPPWGGRDYDKRRVTFDDLAMDVRPLLAAHAGTTILKLPPSFDVAELPPGFEARVLFDERAVPKCLAAIRP